MEDLIETLRSGQAAAPASSSEAGTWDLAHQPAAAREARQITEHLLDSWRLARDEADALVLVVSELVTNAVEHAAPPLALHLHRDAETAQVHVEVTDGGPAAREGDWAVSCVDGEYGRGLDIIDRVTLAHGERHQEDRVTYWADVITA